MRLRVCSAGCVCVCVVVRAAPVFRVMMMNRTSMQTSNPDVVVGVRRLNKEIKETHHKIWIVTFSGMPS